MPLPSWTISGVLALLLGLYVANRVRGEEHGADQPQDPVTKEFITENNDFWRWLLSGLAVASITAYLVPKIAPAVNSTLQGIPLLTKTAIGIWGLVILREVYDQFG